MARLNNKRNSNLSDINSNMLDHDLIQCESSKFIENLFNISAFENGDSGISYNDMDFSWVDPSRIEAGQKFISKYLHSILLGLIFGALSGSCIPSILSVTLRTGKFHTRTRHLKTIVSFLNWIQATGLINNPQSKEVKSINTVRKIHINIAKRVENGKLSAIPKLPEIDSAHRQLISALQKDLPLFDDQSIANTTLLTFAPVVPLSQLDMLLEFYSFCGLMIANPEKFGFSSQDVDSIGFHGYIEILGIVAQILGISNKWNIFLPQHPIDAQLGCQLIQRDLYIPLNGSISPYVLSSSIEVISNYWPKFQFLNPPRMHGIYYTLIKHVFELNGPNISKSLNLFDKILSLFFLWCLKMNQTNLFWFSNILHYLSIRLVYLLRKINKNSSSY